MRYFKSILCVVEFGHNKIEIMRCAAEHHHFLGRLLGSEDKHLLRKCPCPVLMLKSKAPVVSGIPGFIIGNTAKTIEEGDIS